MKKLLLFTIILTVFTVHSQNIFRDDLNTYISNQQLTGQGTWHSDPNISPFVGMGHCLPFATCTGATIVNFSMNYLNYGTSTKALSLSPDTDGVTSTFTPVTSGDIYIGIVLNISTARTSPLDFFRVLSGSNINTTFRMYVQPITSSTFSIGISKASQGNAIIYTSDSYDYNQDNLLIFKYSQLSGVNDDELRLFVNPNYFLGEPAIPTSISGLPNTIGTDQSGNLDRLGFRQNAGSISPTLTNLPTGKVGLVSVARTWNDLSFLPLSNQEFNSTTFQIASNQINTGLISIKSNMVVDNATLSIYDLQGRTIDSKNISLSDGENAVSIKPIITSGIYIIELVSCDKRFTQKVVVN